MKILNSKNDRLTVRNAEIANLQAKHDATVTVYADLTIAIWFDEITEKAYTKIWKGSAARREYYSHRTVEGAMSYVLTQKEYADSRTAYKTAKKSTENTLKVGDVLYTSWGYEQTNVEFLQVVGLVGKSMVEVREIYATSVEGSSSFMSDSVVPSKDNFKGESARVRVNNGNCFNWGGSYKRHASLYNHGTKGVYRSWYA